MIVVIATIATVIAHTPLWVWALYALLLGFGLARTRDSVMPLARILILPLAVTVLAGTSLLSAGVSALPAALLGLAAGGAAGWRLEPAAASRRLADGRLWLRGEWWSLAQIAVVLVFRYVTNVVAIMDPALSANGQWHTGTVFVSTTLSALFLGRTAARLGRYFAASSQPASG